MDIEFNGIASNTIQEICNNHGVTAEIFPLRSRDTICPREEGREFGDEGTYYLAEESCWHGYYWCGGFRCGRTPHYPTDRDRTTIRTRSGRRESSRAADCTSSDCSGTGDCDTSSDSSGAFIIFFLIIAVVLLLIFLAPIIGPVVVLGFELVLALTLGIFNLITFGIFRKKFKRVIVHFPSSPPKEQLNRIIGDAASFGGLPRRFDHKHGTNGFWILRTGAYLFIPSLVATILVLWLQPSNNVLFWVPIIAFILSIILILFSNLIINRKAKQVAQTL
ncbi:MAG: hypothetical protein JSW11_11190 [Candidatus Heimdallarchaeota archaeon]|nr:MAG: hypothetical protein JSW11_11190 [Candidatus Heimdallarchaeota archaeon]